MMLVHEKRSGKGKGTCPLRLSEGTKRARGGATRARVTTTGAADGGRESIRPCACDQCNTGYKSGRTQRMAGQELPSNPSDILCRDMLPLSCAAAGLQVTVGQTARGSTTRPMIVSEQANKQACSCYGWRRLRERGVDGHFMRTSASMSGGDRRRHDHVSMGNNRQDRQDRQDTTRMGQFRPLHQSE